MGLSTWSGATCARIGCRRDRRSTRRSLRVYGWSIYLGLCADMRGDGQLAELGEHGVTSRRRQGCQCQLHVRGETLHVWESLRGAGRGRVSSPSGRRSIGCRGGVTPTDLLLRGLRVRAVMLHGSGAVGRVGRYLVDQPLLVGVVFLNDRDCARREG